MTNLYNLNKFIEKCQKHLTKFDKKVGVRRETILFLKKINIIPLSNLPAILQKHLVRR